MTSDVLTGASVEERATKQVDGAGRIYASSVAHFVELSDIAAKANVSAVDILHTRVAEMFDEFRALFGGRGTTATSAEPLIAAEPVALVEEVAPIENAVAAVASTATGKPRSATRTTRAAKALKTSASGSNAASKTTARVAKATRRRTSVNRPHRTYGRPRASGHHRTTAARRVDIALHSNAANGEPSCHSGEVVSTIICDGFLGPFEPLCPPFAGLPSILIARAAGCESGVKIANLNWNDASICSRGSPPVLNERPIAIVTGATRGIGRWIALGMARAGHHVVMIGRDRARGVATQTWIDHQVPRASTELLIADLSLLSETRNAGKRIAARYSRISVLSTTPGSPIPPNCDRGGT